jgi:beta-mannan synthase
MFYYAAFAAMFTVFAIDQLFYTTVALLAMAHEVISPPVGHPRAIARWEAKRGNKPAPASRKPKKGGKDEDAPVVVYANDRDAESAGPVRGVHQSLVDMYDHYPTVVVQVPMYNEESYCQIVIEKICKIQWPTNRLLLQICDDSTRQDIMALVDAKSAEMRARGFPIQVARRQGKREGYKAGAMVQGMEQLAFTPDYLAIFDADFDPPADFLYQTIYHMERNRRLGFVQGCWTYTNTNTWLTWAQKLNLDFHFNVEQRARSYMQTFFGFNGTAGVWRYKTIVDSGGWHYDNTVEDMDLSIRAYLRGWKFMYLDHVKSDSELPPTMSVYKGQQYRWLSGPAVVLRKIFNNIWFSQAVSFTDRLSCTYFFIRYIFSTFVTGITLFIPMIHIFLETWHWDGWAEQWFFISGNCLALLFAVYTPWFIMYSIFQTITGYFRVYSMGCGLFGTEGSKSWKVTKKFGAGQAGQRRFECTEPYYIEFGMSIYYAVFAVISHLHYGGTAPVLTIYCTVFSIGCLIFAWGDQFL